MYALLLATAGGPCGMRTVDWQLGVLISPIILYTSLLRHVWSKSVGNGGPRASPTYSVSSCPLRISPALVHRQLLHG